MHATKTLLLLTSCALCIAFAQAARADYFGLEVIDRSSSYPICQDQTEPYIPQKLDLCEVYVIFDNTADRLISVAFTNVSTTDPAGFFQHPLGGNTAPACAFISLYPTLVCDSFVSLGVDCFDLIDRTTTDPDFDFTAFNTSGTVSGGWFNSAPSSGQGDPDANGRVMIARFSYKQNKNTSGDVCIFAQLAGSKDIVAFLLEPFDCSVPGGGLPAGPPPSGPTPTLFVDDDDPGTGSCLSWADACPDLQTALGMAGDPAVIRVAGGTYAPAGPAGDRADSFQLINNVVLEGGFLGCPGGTCVSPDDRDIQLYETILSGDLNSNDLPKSCMEDSDCDLHGRKCLDGFCILPDQTGDNSYHVVMGSGTDNTARLDGFTITAGNADAMGFPDDSGGGMLNIAGSPTVANCTFKVNSARVFGGGMQNDWELPSENPSNPLVTDCTFRNNVNTDGVGGGLYTGHSAPTITNCAFEGNVALHPNFGGAGGMCNNFGSDSIVTGCRFEDNSARNGGGMGNNNDSNPTVTNCDFINNSTLANGGGGGMYNNTSRPPVTNCTFVGNSAHNGAGMANTDGSNPPIEDSLFDGNPAVAGGGGMYNDDSNPNVTHCVFQGNTAAYGGGMYNITTSDPVVTNCTFTENVTIGGAGGMINHFDSCPVLTNCHFSGNTGGQVAGAIWHLDSGNLSLTNCSFTGNNATIIGDAILVSGSAVTLSNCILWGDGGSPSGVGEEIHLQNSSTATVNYSNVEGGELAVFDDSGIGLTWGAGNIGELAGHDPLFANAGAGNLHITPGSPCIDAAINTAPGLVGITTDLDGLPRFVEDLDTIDCPHVEDPTACGVPPIADMGAYEFQLCPGASGTCPWDLFPEAGGDGEIGPGDLAVLLGNWGLNPGHPADFDCNAFVKAFDLANLLGKWGACP